MRQKRSYLDASPTLAVFQRFGLKFQCISYILSALLPRNVLRGNARTPCRSDDQIILQRFELVSHSDPSLVLDLDV
jgi:hypothetical protein